MTAVANHQGVDIEGKVLTFTRTFDYPQEVVWAAFTESDHLRRWWGPEPWGVSDSNMDFRPGGSWHYAMQGPDGTKSWGLMLYKEIEPTSRLSYQDAFADEHGNPNNDFPIATGEWLFTDLGNGKTEVKMITNYADESQLQTVVEMGMLEGMAVGLKQLEAVLASIG
jgi:uncharacterized protein YndB with AHSA1/START domain